MVYIPAGEFTMGSSDKREGQKPFHKVHLDGYWMGKTEVTVTQYMEFAINTDSHYPEWFKKKEDGYYYNKYKDILNVLKGYNNYPIFGICWINARAYCKWLSKKTGLKFKLPTEAQWEKASRGTDGRMYPWGNHDPYYNGKYYANYWAENGFRYTAPVGSYPVGESPYGLLDMAGKGWENVWEWCSDWYDNNYIRGYSRVIRGGGWGVSAEYLHCAYRNYFVLRECSPELGFRLCQENR